jgi:hypothetical protein
MRQKVRWLSRSLIVGPYLAICFTEDEFRGILKYLEIKHYEWPQWITPGADATTHTLGYKNKIATVICIHIPPEMDPVAVAGLMVHEAVHVFQRYCQSIGEDEPSLEFEAYSIQHISQQFMWEYVDYLKEQEDAAKKKRSNRNKRRA